MFIFCFVRLLNENAFLNYATTLDIPIILDG
jgi:hypothetical protein